MQSIFRYPLTIVEHHLDSFGHVNNATYLELFEQARWEIIHSNGYGLDVVRQTQIGPIVLEVSVQFKKELILRQCVVIETQWLEYSKKIYKIQHRIVDSQENVYATALLTGGLFDLKSRKLIKPTQKWLGAIGMSVQNQR